MEKEFHSFDELRGMFPEELPEISIQEKSKESQRPLDKLAREFLDKNPQLNSQIISVCQEMESINSCLPVIHITSRAIKREDGAEIQTGFEEKIYREGFKSRHTNIGAFLDKSGKNLAEPSFFAENPVEFVKQIQKFIDDYLHHGLRTNKEDLGKNKGTGIGLPVALIIDSNGIKIKHGSDRPSHYQFAEKVPGEKILETVNLEKGTELENLTKAFLKSMQKIIAPKND